MDVKDSNQTNKISSFDVMIAVYYSKGQSQQQPQSRGGGYSDDSYNRDSGRGDKRKMDFDDYGRQSNKRGAGFGQSGIGNHIVLSPGGVVKIASM